MRPNDGNPYAPLVRKTLREEESIVAEKEEIVEEESVPEDANTVKKVLEWVDEDADRALLALEQEEASDKPRTSLVTALEDIINV